MAEFTKGQRITLKDGGVAEVIDTDPDRDCLWVLVDGEPHDRKVWTREVADGVTGTLSEQEKELGACSISRAAIGDRTHDRRTQESDRSAGEEKQRGGQAGRCDAVRAGGAELGARGDNAAQHEVSEGGGTGNGAAAGVKGPDRG